MWQRLGLTRLSLQQRLAFALALAAAVPLLLAMLLVGQREAQTLRADALTRQERQAATLASAVEDYVTLHRAAVNALAAQPDLLGLPTAAQHTQLQIITQAFPDISSTALFDADGNQIRRSDAITTSVPVRGYPVYELARESNAASLDILQSPVLHEPIVAFGAPVHDAAGNFGGLVVAALPTTHIVQFLATQNANRSGLAYLVDGHGRVIAHADPALVASSADLSQTPVIAAALDSRAASGSLNYTASQGEQLAGYARVAGVGWTVVVDRPADDALAGLYRAQAGILAILAGGLMITVTAGYLLAGRITAPVNLLLQDIHALGREPVGSPAGDLPRSPSSGGSPSLGGSAAEGDLPRSAAEGASARATGAAVSGPASPNLLAAEQAARRASGVPEIAELLAAFRDLRGRLAARTAEAEEEMTVRVHAEASLRQALAALSQHEEALRQANEELEGQVAAATADLRHANSQLRAELGERRRAEAERERLLHENRNQRELLERLIAAAPAGIAVVRGPEHRFEVANPAFQAIPGDPVPQIVGRTWREVWASLGPHSADLLDRVYATGQTVSVRASPASLGVAGREETYWDADHVPLRAADGSVDGVLILANEVTAQVLARRHVEEGRARAEELAAELERRVYERTQELQATAESLAQANERLRMFYDIDQAVLAARSPAEIAQAALDRIGQVIAYDRASILLIDRPAGLVRFLATAGVPLPGFEPEDRFPLEDWTVPADLQQGVVHGAANLSQDGNPPALAQALFAAGLRRRVQAPLFVGGQLIGSLNLLSRDPNGLPPPAAEIAAQVALSLAVAIQNAQLDEQVQASRVELQALNRRMVELQENERRAIARELHDEAGQALATLMIGLGLIEREAGQPAAVLERVAELKQTTDTVLGDLHDLAVDLRPASLDRLGLLPALGQYVDTYRRQTGLNVVLESVGIGSGERFTPEVETTVYRVIQEALTNVARHANATYAGVLVERRGKALVGIVEDDGAGFEPGPAQERERLGLLGMRERAEMVGGALTIESAPGAGTTVFIEVPLS